MYTYTIRGYYLLPNNTVDTMAGVMKYYDYDLAKVNAPHAYVPVTAEMLYEVMRDFEGVAGTENFTTEVFRRILHLPDAVGWLLALREGGYVDTVKVNGGADHVVWRVIK